MQQREAGAAAAAASASLPSHVCQNIAPSCGPRQVHLIRHGQGFHNLMADVYRSHGVKFASTGKDLSENNPYRSVTHARAPAHDQATRMRHANAWTQDTIHRHRSVASVPSPSH